MSGKRVLKSSHGVTLSEHELSDGKAVIARAYTVKSPRTPELPNFSTIGEAEVYFDSEVLRVLNPKNP